MADLLTFVVSFPEQAYDRTATDDDSEDILSYFIYRTEHVRHRESTE